MQPTARLLKLQFRARIRLVTNAVSIETLTVSDFLLHHIFLRMRHGLRIIGRWCLWRNIRRMRHSMGLAVANIIT